MLFEEWATCSSTFRQGGTWLDTDTMEILVDAADIVCMIEARQGAKIIVPEEITF